MSFAKSLFLISILSVSLFVISCGSQGTGINKNLNTGMTTKWSGIKPENSKMVMNGEELNHNDIPIGESFEIINEGVVGLTIKDNKVSVGCSLEISDSGGHVLLSEPDLFEGKNEFDNVDFLRCRVNTGEPMKWEEKYKVKVIFTDKYGKGRIENDVTIRAIDIP